MPGTEQNENHENNITKLTDRFKERVIDLEKRMNELDNLIKSSQIVCQQCQQPFPELMGIDNAISMDSKLSTEINCPQCGFTNIIKKP
jgi:DNA-directed RNA polymerase subunit RPC12/RpoP